MPPAVSVATTILPQSATIARFLCTLLRTARRRSDIRNESDDFRTISPIRRDIAAAGPVQAPGTGVPRADCDWSIGMSKLESRSCRKASGWPRPSLRSSTVPPASAQVTTGTIAGRIADAQGAAVPGVVVTVTSERRNTLLGTVITNDSGEFVVPNVAADTYVIEAKIEGFKPVRRGGVSVSGGERVVIPTISLEIGGIGETVDVVAKAALLQTQSGERSYTVTTTQLSEVPVSGRNFASFAALAPGVAGTARIGGGGTNQVMIDGVAAVDVGNNAQLLQLNPDAIAEVRVVTSGYQAEFGRASGIQITAVTKSGTNTFHGSGYEIAERSRWNSVPWLNQQNGTAPGRQQDRCARVHPRRSGRTPGRREQALLFLRP